ncbi:MAG: putative toxin-antitoxin system toxin component, PIN family [candidate division KSB1 bacterium]|nr:putative toxin-antitoxin system toxin component, PIN family [candidate division KSB1 bacterium]MDZ7300935.1 putative toxin-antitoxin system toxin component, PIN family [candidate division KSB1 bacterium]MDZ7310386.1 putative toxin-antitoxin system toxin component, PIN family [candidate division KSB1 bacterium]
MGERIRVVRAVLDTNIFLRSLIREGNISDKIIGHWKDDDFLLMTSKDILKEAEKVLKRPWLVEKYGYELEQVDRLVELISQKAIFVEPAFSLELCRDPNDDKFVDCSILGRVQFLVSEDNDILDDENLKKHLLEYGIEIQNALGFYQKLRIILTPFDPLPEQ